MRIKWRNVWGLLCLMALAIVFSASLVLASGTNRIVGTPGDDVLGGTRGEDVLVGHGGDDRLWGGRGEDVFLCGPGDDVVHNKWSNDEDVIAPSCEVVK